MSLIPMAPTSSSRSRLAPSSQAFAGFAEVFICLICLGLPKGFLGVLLYFFLGFLSKSKLLSAISTGINVDEEDRNHKRFLGAGGSVRLSKY